MEQWAKLATSLQVAELQLIDLSGSFLSAIHSPFLLVLTYLQGSWVSCFGREKKGEKGDSHLGAWPCEESELGGWVLSFWEKLLLLHPGHRYGKNVLETAVQNMKGFSSWPCWAHSKEVGAGIYSVDIAVQLSGSVSRPRLSPGLHHHWGQQGSWLLWASYVSLSLCRIRSKDKLQISFPITYSSKVASNRKQLRIISVRKRMYCRIQGSSQNRRKNWIIKQEKDRSQSHLGSEEQHHIDRPTGTNPCSWSHVYSRERESDLPPCMSITGRQLDWQSHHDWEEAYFPKGKSCCCGQKRIYWPGEMPGQVPPSPSAVGRCPGNVMLTEKKCIN